MVDEVNPASLSLLRISDKRIGELFHVKIFLVIRKDFRLPIYNRNKRVEDSTVAKSFQDNLITNAVDVTLRDTYDGQFLGVFLY